MQEGPLLGLGQVVGEEYVDEAAPALGADARQKGGQTDRMDGEGIIQTTIRGVL